MTTIKSGNTEQFKEYSQFASLTEFNHNIEMWLSEHKDDFSKSELIGLKRLVRFSAKFPGVCNAKIGTILRAIHKEYNDNGISRSTFKRMVVKAKELGIFTVYETERANGSQSSNLYVFNHFPSSEPPKQEMLDQPIETSNLLKTKKDLKKRKQVQSELDHTFVSNRVPEPFVELVKCYFPEAKTIEEYWHMVQIAAHRYEFTKDSEQVLEVAIESFKQMIRRLKFTGTIRKPIAYFYGILDKKLFQHYDRAHAEEVDSGQDLFDSLISRLEKDGYLHPQKEFHLRYLNALMGF